jgi:hypothetical protein
MTEWIDAKTSQPDDGVVVWVSDCKSVGLSEYSHGLGDWLYCDSVVDPVMLWQPIEYPEVP